jgi:polar amino acid transport system substrate-binding protein
MKRQFAGMMTAVALAAMVGTPVEAGTIFDRIQKTGTITAGARKDAIPFGYVNSQGKWVGYSIDMLELIRKEAEQRLGKPIKLKLVEVNPQNRLEKIKSGAIDIECGSTTFTWKRENEVDFSVSYFANGTQLLVKKGSELDAIETLARKRIGVIANTTNESVIKTQQPAAILVKVKDRQEGLQKLEAGEIDGFASDGITLEGLRKQAKNGGNLTIVPQYPYAYESYACVLPQDDSKWRDLVNYSLVRFMEGIVSDQQRAVTILDRWFGDTGAVPYSREAINDYFQGIVNAYEWIPLTGK